MIINGINLKQKYGKKIIIGQQTVRERSVITFTNWLDESDKPIENTKPKVKFFDIEAEFIVIGSSKKDAEITASNIVADCISGDIKLDNMDMEFRGEMKEEKKEFLKQWEYSLNITFQAWEKSEKEVSVKITEDVAVIDVDGNQVTPCIIEIIPKSDIISFKIGGVTRDSVTGEDEYIMIKNLSAGKKIVINGEDDTVLEDGMNKFADTEMWEFPSLLPGENILSFVSSSVPCDVTIKYKPRYI